MESSNRRRSFSWKRAAPWFIPALFIILWFVLSNTGRIPPYLMPRPSDIITSGMNYLFGKPESGPYAGRFLNDAGASLVRVGLGFALAALLGIPLGVMSGRVPAARNLLSSSINGLRAVPGICWLPLALVWFGIGIKTTVFLVALAAFFPIYLNAAAGARQINMIWYQSGAMMGIGRVRGVFAILLPASMPYILTGLRLGLGISWAYLVLGELTGVPNGLGAVIMDARMLGRIDIIVVGIIIIAVMGRMSDLLLKTVMFTCFKSARRSP